MDKLNQIAKGDARSLRKISDMVVEKLYLIEGLKIVTTTYGDKVVFDLKND